MTVYTIGHSTRTIEQFIDLLEQHGISLLVDVRTVPGSRHNPQFNREDLSDSLRANGIEYKHFPDLGGLRKAKKDSVNLGWRNLSFRGFADYMQTQEFSQALERMIELAAGQTTAIMCAEAVPWRCHRSLIADALTVRGITCIEIIYKATQIHKLTPFAKVNGPVVTYPAAESTAGVTGFDDMNISAPRSRSNRRKLTHGTHSKESGRKKRQEERANARGGSRAKGRSA